jgi:aquaporin Z
VAFGLTLLTMCYAIGHISGSHVNPAVTLGLAVGRRFAWKDVVPYMVAQVIGAVAAAGVLFFIASGRADFTIAGGFAANGYAAHSPQGYSMAAGWVTEVVLTFGFVMIILGATDSRVPAGFAPLAIGLALTLVHLVGIPVTNMSVNPARSTGPALFVRGWALAQLWMFWIAPLIGGALAGVVYPMMAREKAGKRGKAEMEPAHV